ncbi:AHH domain-containing protein [Kitasatospora sp. LaBMicrA B282]|uniref:AHH domain-containing protein n=1 Tax=Kitasatospora sp. LaBMicrA B282 TaxID=3420949 RepID=UPI003D130087
MSSAGDTLTVRLHLPTAVTFDGEPAQDRRAALERVLLQAVGRAAAALQETERRVTGRPLPPVAAGPDAAGGPDGEPAGGEAAGGGVQLAFTLPAELLTDLTVPPSGEPVPVPTPVPPPAAARPTRTWPSAPEPTPAPTPASQAQAQAMAQAAPELPDEVVEGPSGLAGRILMILPGTRIVTVGSSTRYVRATSVPRALQLGRAVFGTTSFALLQGPVGTSDSRYWVVATDPPIANADLDLRGRVPTGPEMKGLRGLFLRQFKDAADHGYDIVAVLTRERNPITVDREAARAFYRAATEGGAELPAEQARALVFDRLDQLVDAALATEDGEPDGSRLQEAADRLAELDLAAFELVDWQTKARYLTVLIEAWTRERHERAIVELMRSLDSLAELAAVQQRLAEAGVAAQLFRDVGPALWDLLTTVGARFGDQRTLTFGEVAELVDESFQLSPQTRAQLRESAAAGGAAVLAEAVRIEATAAAGAVLSLLEGMVDGLRMVVTRPDEVLLGLGQLARLIGAFEFAAVGYGPARAECELVLRQLGTKLAAGLRGAALLHVGPNVVATVRWAVLVELASWFVGVGQLKAAAEAVGLGEKLTLVARLVGLVGRTTKTVEGRTLALRLGRLAQAMHTGSTVLREVAGADEVLRLLARLPVEEQRRLAVLLEAFEVAEGSTLAELAAHRALGPVVQRSLRRAEILQTFAAKSGGLTEELGQAFGHLTGPGGFADRDLAAVAQALPPGEGSAFLAALERIGYQRIGPSAELGADFLTALAGSPRAVDATRAVGWRVVRAAFEQAGGEATAFDAILLDLARLENAARAQQRFDTYLRILEQLANGDPEAWRLVAGAHLVAPRVERAAVLARIRSLRAGFRGRAVDRAALERRLDRLAELARRDPALALEVTELAEARRLGRGVAFADEQDLARAFEDAAQHASHDEKVLLFEEPVDVPPEAPVVSERPNQPMSTGGSPSEALERAMAAAGDPRPPGHETHHIVPAGDPRAAIARHILEDAGIDVRQGVENGIHLPRTSTDPATVPQALTRHPTLHTDAYYRELTLRLIEAAQDGTVRGTLAQIRHELEEGLFFHLEDGATKGERFADWLLRHGTDYDRLTSEELEAIVEATRRRPRAPRGRPRRER